MKTKILYCIPLIFLISLSFVSALSLQDFKSNPSKTLAGFKSLSYDDQAQYLHEIYTLSWLQLHRYYIGTGLGNKPGHCACDMPDLKAAFGSSKEEALPFADYFFSNVQNINKNTPVFIDYLTVKSGTVVFCEDPSLSNFDEDREPQCSFTLKGFEKKESNNKVSYYLEGTNPKQGKVDISALFHAEKLSGPGCDCPLIELYIDRNSLISVQYLGTLGGVLPDILGSFKVNRKGIITGTATSIGTMVFDKETPFTFNVGKGEGYGDTPVPGKIAVKNALIKSLTYTPAEPLYIKGSATIADYNKMAYNGSLAVAMGDVFSINGFEVNAKAGDVPLRFGKKGVTQCLKDWCDISNILAPNEDRENFIRFSDKIEIQGSGFSLRFNPQNLIDNEKSATNGYTHYLALPQKGYYAQGDKGDNIKLIQRFLGVSESGNFDSATEQGLEKFQNDYYSRYNVCIGKTTANSCEADGRLGPKTLEVITKGVSPKRNVGNTLEITPEGGLITLGNGKTGIEVNVYGKSEIKIGGKKFVTEQGESAKGEYAKEIGNLIANGVNVPVMVTLRDEDGNIVGKFASNKQGKLDENMILNKGSGHTTSSGPFSGNSVVKAGDNTAVTSIKEDPPNFVTAVAVNTRDILDKLKSRYPKNGDYYFREIPDDINSKVLLISGHHMTGFNFFFGEKDIIDKTSGKSKTITVSTFGYDELPASDQVEYVLLTGCHVVMNPAGEQPRFFLSPNTVPLVEMLTKKYPNLKAIIGYDSKAPAEDSTFWANFVMGLEKTKEENLVKYTMAKSLQEFGKPTEEKYAIPFHSGTVETGQRLGIIIRENNTWVYYSPLQQQGVEVKSYGTLTKRVTDAVFGRTVWKVYGAKTHMGIISWWQSNVEGLKA